MASNLDMFSLLPEFLLLVIISFLPFKEAVRTSILSKRWLKIWQSMRNVEFNEFFVKHDDETEKEVRRRNFLNFITHWIANYNDSVVDKFSLKVSNPENCSEIVKHCVAFATQRGVKELALDFSNPTWEENDFDDHDPLFDLPEHVYGHGSLLESLKLYSCSFAMPEFLNFRSLKDVSLGWIEVNHNTLQTLLSTCKMIENLSFKKCWGLDHFDMGEEKLGLTRLVIDKCHIGTDYFRFNAPKLTFFKYSGVVLISDIVVQPHVMEEADIDLAQESEFHECGTELYKLLEDLYPVRVLTVCSFLLQVIPSREEPVRVQCGLNVRHLIMKTQMHHYELCGFEFLLNSCPMLEKLTLEIVQGKILPDYILPYGVDLNTFWGERRIISTCLIKTLKVVEIKGFRGTMNELMACYYFIKAGKVLEQINIQILKEDDGNYQEVEKLRKLARHLLHVTKASKNLKITIV